MGQEPSKPRPGTKLQVIGDGLPRTGTSSLSIALSTLLHGPVYHGGTQSIVGHPSEIKSWIEPLSHFPAVSPFERDLVKSILKERLDGFAAVTDSPCNGLIPELLELHPDAIVICTGRNPEAWTKSMETA